MNLPKVPACDECNGRKSHLEHYATTILPFGGRHAAAIDNLRTLVPPRLEKNARLHRDIVANMRRAWAQHGSFVLPTASVPVDGERIHELFRFVGRGLVSYEFGVTLKPSDLVEVTTLTAQGMELFETQFFGPHVSSVRHVDLGAGTVVYEGLQAQDMPEATVWRIQMYGGMWMLSDSTPPEANGSLLGIMTGPEGMDGGA
ncbi:MAG: hypothetical protein EG823_08300 [Actinobacteria bacterium]|nr:hypothetical protein [Actinomycetota bacterium]